MIEELKLTNCQSHKSSHLKFHPGLNVIVGDTDSGKSAIIRGLDKVIYNSFPSKELISHWGGPLILALKIDGSDLILKNDGKDSYQLNKLELNALNGKVPNEVASILNMSDINFQDQSTNWFLLNETSGFVASYLNKIANLSQIDSTTKAIKSELNATERSIEHNKKDLAEKEKTLEYYKFLPQFETAIKEAEQLEENINTFKVERNVIKVAIDNIGEINIRLTKIQKLIHLKPLIEQSITLIEEKETLENKLTKLINYIDTLQTLEFEFEKINKISKLKPVINISIKLKKKESDFKAKLDTLELILHKLSTLDKEIKTAIAKRESEHELYHSELQKLDKCFFCGSKLN